MTPRTSGVSEATMKKDTPATGGSDPAVVAGESWTLKLVKVEWPILAAVLVLVSAVIALFAPDRMAAWGQALPILSGIVTVMGGVAFGGPALKRAQENASYRDETAR